MNYLHRIIENQAALSSYKATQNEEQAVVLELLIEQTKPTNVWNDWHPLISTPFRYTPPHPEARFRPPYGRNIFYGSAVAETAMYEHAYHFMKERQHLKMKTETGLRTLFVVKAHDDTAYDLKSHTQYNLIMHATDYSFSHTFITDNPTIDFIYYPSIRDPQHRNNAAILNIHHLDKTPITEYIIKFFYNNTAKKLHWLEDDIVISWKEIQG